MNKSLIYLCFYLVVILILPIGSLISYNTNLSISKLIHIIKEPIAIYAYKTTTITAITATLISLLFGYLVAWTFSRYDFPYKQWFNFCINLSFATPSSVIGLSLVDIYHKNSYIGKILNQFNIKITFNNLGIIIAMIFVSYPIVIRNIEPTIQQIEKSLEEASWSLGASKKQTFTYILIPLIIPSLISSAALSLARSFGEYGAIIMISSNIPYKDLTCSVLIAQNLEQYDYQKASIISIVIITISLLILIIANFLRYLIQQNEY
uniref:Sulfate transport system permease protein n=1 Tax=Cyanidium sp. THAL103 TaxID=3027999 RepID=A0A9Y1I4A3_9RHOD|nr:sulfate transport system permease protein [Cyanidium sp. THAL103]